MVQPIGNFSSIAPLPSVASAAGSPAQAASTAAEQLVEDTLNLSQQALAALAKLDTDGDGDGH